MIEYSPFIADTIPGFNTGEIKIPYIDSIAVAKQGIKGYSLKMWPYNSQDKIATTKVLSKEATDQDKAGTVTFDGSSESIVTGQYYKFQLAYISADDNSVGPYSSVAIGRCVGEPGLTIEMRDNGVQYEGQYQNTLISEPVYSYYYTLTSNGQILEATDIMTHDTTLDEIKTIEIQGVNTRVRTSIFPIYLRAELKASQIYNLQLTITTINGYVATTSTTVIKEPAAPAMFTGGVACHTDVDNGYIGIALTGDTIVEGTYLLERRAADEDIWYRIAKFQMLTDYKPADYTWKDHSVEQGVIYIYSIRHCYNDQHYSERIMSTPIKAEFDHMFLSDADKTLRIAFNPQVSSLKDTILEQKMDTIGGQYPFFFRNNQVRYKEIPISGLLSYLEDTEGFFGTHDLNTTNLTADNFAAERKFKLAVLEWLTNGKPKLFRSPAEGNYAVRLMNTSLSPNDTLGRMLHTFSSTGYECMDSDYETLAANKIVPSQEIKLRYLRGDKSKLESPSLSFTAKEIRNAIWITAHPNTTTKIRLDETAYTNIMGKFQTAEDDVYKTITVDSDVLERGDEIIFEYIPTEADTPPHEQFIGNNSSARVLISIRGNDIKLRTVINEFATIEKIMVTCYDPYDTETETADYVFNISSNADNFSCQDGQTRIYQGNTFELSQIQDCLTGGSNVLFYILGTTIENYSAALGNFILGYSKLGGNE